MFGVKYSFVSFLDDDHQRFVACDGSLVGPVAKSETMCAVAGQSLRGDALVVLDARQDPRFSQLAPVAGPPGIRFYAGIPIRVEQISQAVTVCIADTEPRPAFGDVELRRLHDLAVFVRAILAARRHGSAVTKALTEREDAERRFRLIADNTSDIIVTGDLNLQRTYVSPAVRHVLGYEPAEFIGRPINTFIHADDAHLIVDPIVQAQNGVNDPQIRTVRYLHKRGHHVWIEVSVRFPYDSDTGRPIGYVAVLRDVTQRENAEAQVQHMGLHDVLTGLPNRILFRDRLAQAMAKGAWRHTPFAALVCDIDHFKAVNDSLGHAAGDKLIRIASRRMLTVLRPHDTLARIGGDEFGVILTDMDSKTPWTYVAERLIEVVSAPMSLEGRSVEVGLSIGVVIGNGVGSVEDVFRRADVALYEAKASGRNAVREFRDEAGARMTRHGQLALDMKDAIRREEFYAQYQPVVEVESGRVATFEALLRWRHPREGEVPPATFIPIAEETGLIVQLGTWVLRQACWEALNWPEHVKVAVNVSAVQLLRNDFHATVSQILAATGLPASRLKLEITESVLLRETEEVLGCLHGLRRLGVLIVLDDFGTGYSSLSYLRRFPFDRIKIDRAFIGDIAHADTAAIVRAVVGIGERLGIGVVAEGVETEKQLALVRHEGCREVQGFFYSRPLSGSDAEAYARTGPARAAA